MKNALFAAAVVISQVNAGFLPPEEKMLDFDAIDPE
jgi:hypothetical protein